MPYDADLSLPAIATTVAEFLTELDLHQITLVSDDWAARSSSSLQSPERSKRVRPGQSCGPDGRSE